MVGIFRTHRIGGRVPADGLLLQLVHRVIRQGVVIAIVTVLRLSLVEEFRVHPETTLSRPHVAIEANVTGNLSEGKGHLQQVEGSQDVEVGRVVGSDTASVILRGKP